MGAISVEERLVAVEQELQRLKNLLCKEEVKIVEPQWKHIIGVFKDDPMFDEAERLGREWRDSQRMEYDEDADTSA